MPALKLVGRCVNVALKHVRFFCLEWLLQHCLVSLVHRRWYLSSDDLVVPAFMAGVFMLAWTALLGAAEGSIMHHTFCSSRTFEDFVISMLAFSAAGTLLQILLLVYSAKGVTWPLAAVYFRQHTELSL